MPLPRTPLGWWARALQLLAGILALCWPPLGRALGHLHWGAWALVAPFAVVVVVIAAGILAIFHAKDRPVLLIILFAITTTAFVLVGLLLLGFAIVKPDNNPG